jgi:uncharacterized protein (TIGR03437 family)
MAARSYGTPPPARRFPFRWSPGELGIDGALSGSGEFAFVSTDHARIVRFQIGTGAVSNVFPVQLGCDNPGPVALGSLVRLHGCTFSGTVADLQGHVSYNGVETPVLYAHNGEVGIQIDWYKDFWGNDTLSNDLLNSSPFQAEQSLAINDAAPMILPADPGTGSLFGIQIIKGDFSGYVTRSPLPGDIIHMYMTGLGWVNDRPAIGVPATAANRMQWKLACRFQPGGQMVTPLWAGLAPGMLGVYQTTFAVPSGSGPVTTTDLSCTLTTPSGQTGTFGPGTRVFGMCAVSCGIVMVLP